MVFQREEKTGVTAFGYVENLRTFVKEANELVSPELPEFKAFEINKLVDDCIANRTVDFRNKFGKSSKEDSALYAILATSKSTSTGEKIIAMYTRQRLEKNWTGIYFLTERLLKNEIRTNLYFKIGDMFFENWHDGLQFLDELMKKAIPEKWSYQSHNSGIPQPILKSYIENMFEKLKKENGGNKIIRSDDNKYLVFNSGLLDKFFHEIYIICHIVLDEGDEAFRNPYIMSSLTDLT